MQEVASERGRGHWTTVEDTIFRGMSRGYTPPPEPAEGVDWSVNWFSPLDSRPLGTAHGRRGPRKGRADGEEPGNRRQRVRTRDGGALVWGYTPWDSHRYRNDRKKERKEESRRNVVY
jgi:hypothetical protein